QFGSDLDRATQARLARGQRVTEILKQGQYQPMPVEEQVAVIYTAVNGHLDDVPVEKIRLFEQRFLEYLRSQAAVVLDGIRETKQLSDELVQKLEEAIKAFKEGFRE